MADNTNLTRAIFRHAVQEAFMLEDSISAVLHCLLKALEAENITKTDIEEACLAWYEQTSLHIHLIVKGSLKDAVIAATSRGIGIVSGTDTPDNEVYLRVRSEYSKQVCDWFNENFDTGSPLPAGALLHWSQIS